MKPRQAGKYRQRIKLYDVPETIRSTYGQPSLLGTLLGSYRAEVRPLQGREQLNVRQMFPTASHLVRIPWLGSAVPNVVPRMKLTLVGDSMRSSDAILNILNANDVENRHIEWELTCEEHVGASS